MADLLICIFLVCFCAGVAPGSFSAVRSLKTFLRISLSRNLTASGTLWLSLLAVFEASRDSLIEAGQLDPQVKI
jgi:hypothetical protein